MLKSIWEDVKREFSYGNMVTRIIIINIAFFVFINTVLIILRISNAWETPDIYYHIRNFFLISSSWKHNLTHPWVLVTTLFFHEGFLHILWNMLFLYWFGRIVGDFIGNQRVFPIYLLGGLAGSLVYFIYINSVLQPGEGPAYAMGASASVMAIVLAAGVIAPDYIIRLLFLGDIKLKYIVGAMVFLDLIGMAGNINTGGHFAHLGGAAMGWLLVWQLRQGNDWSAPVNKLLDRIVDFFRGLAGRPGSRRGPRVVYRNTSRNQGHSRRGNSASDHSEIPHQERLDSILDKIKQSGYESLSEEEKEFLFNASKK